MNSFPRLLCVATLATAAFAQTPKSSFVTADPSLANELQPAKPQAGHPQTEAKVMPAATSAEQADLQIRSIPGRTVLPTATVLRLKLSRAISTDSARPGETFNATLTHPIEVGGKIMIPAGTLVHCRVDGAHGAHRFAGKPSLSIKAVGVHTPNGEELSFSASVVDTGSPRQLDVDQEGRVRGASPNPMNKIELGALAGAGAVAGAVIAGPEGLLIGTASGAVIAAGHIIVKHRDLTLPSGTELIFELDSPVTASRSQMGGTQ